MAGPVAVEQLVSPREDRASHTQPGHAIAHCSRARPAQQQEQEPESSKKENAGTQTEIC